MITFLAAVGLLIECISFSNLSFLRLVALAPATKEPRGSVEANILLALRRRNIEWMCMVIGRVFFCFFFQRFAHRLVLLQIQSANVCVRVLPSLVLCVCIIKILIISTAADFV